MISEEIYAALVKESEKIGVFAHGFTYSGHPVSAAVALETLKIYEEIDLVGRVRDIAPHMQARLAGFRDHPLAGEVAGIGLLGVFELVRDHSTRAPFEPVQKAGPRLVDAAQ